MIFRDITDVQEVFAGPSIDNNFQTISPYLDDAKTHLYPFISADFYEAIASSESEDEVIVKVLKLMRKPLVHFAYLAYGVDGVMQIDDSGFHRVETQDQKSAYQWMMLRYDKARTTKAWESVEQLIIALEKIVKTEGHNEIFNTYKNSEERKYIKEFFVWRSDDFRRYRKVENWFTIQVMLGGMAWVQRNVIQNNIGTTMYHELLDKCLNDDFTADQKKLLPYIKEAVINLAIYRTIEEGLLDQNEFGLTTRSIKSDQGAQVTEAEESRIAWLKASAQKDGETAIRLLRDFLNKNSAADKYSSYFNDPTLYVDPTVEKRPSVFKNVEGGTFWM